MTFMNWATLAIAVWGAALSTFLAYRGWKKERPQVSVKANELRVQTGEFDEWLIAVRIENWGSRPVNIESIFFTTVRGRFRWLRRIPGLHRMLPLGEAMGMMERQEVCGRKSGGVPSEITPESPHTVHYEAAWLVKSFTKYARHGTLRVCVSCHDPLHRTWWAKPFRMRIDGSGEGGAGVLEVLQERTEANGDS